MMHPRYVQRILKQNRGLISEYLALVEDLLSIATDPDDLRVLRDLHVQLVLASRKRQTELERDRKLLATSTDKRKSRDLKQKVVVEGE